jgi:hypothetical protein
LFCRAWILCECILIFVLTFCWKIRQKKFAETFAKRVCISGSSSHHSL